MEHTYTPPVDQLLSLGSAREMRVWPNYPDLGLTEEHVPELLRLATDEDIYWAEADGPEIWGPNHAWRALGQLRAESAIEPLITLQREWEESDWVSEEIPQVLGMIGPRAIPELVRRLADEAGPEYDFPAIGYAHALERIGTLHPEVRGEIVSALTDQLRRYEGQDPTLNGFLVSYLIDLHAVEALPVIREVYEKEAVDLTIDGDIEEVEIELGVREKRDTPMPRYSPLPDLDALLPPIRPDKPILGPGERFVEVRTSPKIGRNDPCPCGSGKKYKKCCLNKSG